ncbi:hypothetical protein BS78_03G300100, partial [Paspalum vaginatum]
SGTGQTPAKAAAARRRPAGRCRHAGRACRPRPVERAESPWPSAVRARPPSRARHGLHTAAPGPITAITPRRAPVSRPARGRPTRPSVRPRPPAYAAPRGPRPTEGLQEECRVIRTAGPSK